MLEKATSNSINIMYETKNEHTLIYIINEQGNIFTYIAPDSRREEYLVRIYEFCKNTVATLNSIEETPQVNPKIPTAKIAIDNRGTPSFDNVTKQLEETHLLKFSRSSTLKATIEPGANSIHTYRVSSIDRQSAPALLKDLVSPVRASFSGAQIFPTLTGVEFTKMDAKLLKSGSNSFFLEKYRVEFVMARALGG